jgi:hypothetical protein
MSVGTIDRLEPVQLWLDGLEASGPRRIGSHVRHASIRAGASVGGIKVPLFDIDSDPAGRSPDPGSGVARHRRDRLVFVICAFRTEMEPILEAIREAGKPFDLVVRRVKDVPGTYRITDKIKEMIRDAFIVVADLTYERPNVYHEIGTTQALGKKIIMIAREGTQIHSNLVDWAVLFYTDSRPLERDLRRRFEYEVAGSAVSS